jgi:hypothetical protein
MGETIRHETILTVIAQLRKLAGVVMIIHVKEVAVTYRRTRFEYGRFIGSGVASGGSSLRYRIQLRNCWRAMKNCCESGLERGREDVRDVKSRFTRRGVDAWRADWNPASPSPCS